MLDGRRNEASSDVLGGSVALTMSHLDREGSELFQSAPEQFPQFLRDELARNARLVRLSGARVD